MNQYYVYITTNQCHTVLYVGVTNDLFRRLEQHKVAENGRAFTARYGVKRLLYYETHGNVNDALNREKQLKRWRREKKDWLIETMNPFRKFLDEREEDW